MIARVLCGALLFLIPIVDAQAQSKRWTHTFDFSNRPVSGSAIASDGSILISYNDKTPCVAAIAPNGTSRFTRCYGTAGDFAEVASVPGGGFYLYGSRLRGALPSALFVMKADAAGAVEWTRVLVAPEELVVRSLTALADGGAVLVGGVDAPEAESIATRFGLVVRLARDGTVQWSRAIDSTGYDLLMNAVEGREELFIAGRGESGAFIASLDRDGQFRWNLPTRIEGEPRHALLAPDGSLVFAGQKAVGDSGTSPWLGRVDNKGRMTWQLTARGTVRGGFHAIVPGPGNGEVTAAGTRQSDGVWVLDFVTVAMDGSIRRARTITLGTDSRTFASNTHSFRGQYFVEVHTPTGIAVHALDETLRGSACFESGAADFNFQAQRSDTVGTGYPIENKIVRLSQQKETATVRADSIKPGPACVALARAPSSPVPSSPPAAARSADEEMRDLSDAARAALIRNDFGRLDALSAEFVRTRAELPMSGTSKLVMLIDGLASPSDEFADEAAHIAKLQAWLRQNPKSEAAAAALAHAYLNYAQLARGSSTIGSVTGSAATEFEERLTLARNTLRRTTFADRHPEYQHARIRAAGYGCKGLKQIAYDPAVRAAKYYHSFRSAATFLLPRWCGSPEEYRAFTEYAASAMGEKADQTYALLAWTAASLEPQAVYRTYGFDWPRIGRGFTTLIRKFPQQPSYNHRFAVLAYRTNDRAAARAALSPPQARWSEVAATFWRDRAEYDRIVAWSKEAQPDASVAVGMGQLGPTLLRNEVLLKNGKRDQGFYSFLVETPVGVRAVTAITHLEPRNRYDPSGLTPETLWLQVLAWKMTGPSGLPLRATGILPLGIADRMRSFLMTFESMGPVPVRTLTVRSSPIPMQARVYVITCAPGGPRCEQVVHEGKTAGRSGNKITTLTVVFPRTGLDLSQAIGSPVLDDQGHVVGVVSEPTIGGNGATWFEIASVEELAPLFQTKAP